MSKKEYSSKKPITIIKKTEPLKSKNDNAKALSNPLIKASELPYLLILLAYILITTFTPNWMALDTNAPKFMTLSFVNLAAFIFLLTNKELQSKPASYLKFFKTNIGLAYSGFLIMSLLSFTQAINLKESVLQFSKLFTVFSATYIVSVIFLHNLRLIKPVIIIMTGLLIFDAVSVFYFINKFVNGDIASIADIKTVYSNKNILASSIFVKIPFAIWLLLFEKDWLKRLGWFTLTAAVLATFFMATRAFYLGLFVLSLVFLAFVLFNYFKKKEKPLLITAAYYIVAIVIAYMFFSFIQQNLYPKSDDRFSQGVAAQVASISEYDKSTGLRLNAWRWSFELIKEKPLFGVGSGNWKIAILKHENQVNAGFIYLYKAHNDFIENTVEAGIIGGLFFLFIFIFGLWNLIRQYRIKFDPHSHLFQALFLSTVGMGFYAVDAFFNFPADRPEILILFILFVSSGIASATYQKAQSQIEENIDVVMMNKMITKDTQGILKSQSISASISLMVILLMVGISYTLYLNFQSIKLQRIVYQEIMAGSLRESSTKFVGKFPYIPEISIWGESIPAISARYLLEEKKFKETITLLKEDMSNPYDARKEFFMALAYSSVGNLDSALYFSEKAHLLKPNYFRNLHILLTTLEQKKRDSEIPAYIDHFLENEKGEANAWLFSSGFYSRIGEIDKAYSIIKEALTYMPNDSLINQQENYLHYKKNVEPYSDYFNKAMEFFNKGQHREAARAFEYYLKLVPLDLNGSRMISYSYYQLKEYNTSIERASSYLGVKEPDGQLLNLRGISYTAIGETEKACKDYEASMKLGDPNGKSNYNVFCKNK
ncbi:MAG: hypothetical protein FD155_2528 [Bacteroidetes bacterium]|nr:MAG: hypothetical protein FD155_2528 [Bacteroidota bacterium]